MPRGRHRHSPPLHRLLPPSLVAGTAVLCAAGAWLLTEPLVLRILASGAAVAAVSGAVIMRSWDRSAGLQVADLARGRASDAWQTEERIAELEAETEEARELRARLETKLRAKRVELAALRGEHAALLRRYATAETERASALEGQRQLAIEADTELVRTGAAEGAAGAGHPDDTDSTDGAAGAGRAAVPGARGSAPALTGAAAPKALVAGPGAKHATAAGRAVSAPATASPGAPSAALFERAAKALDDLSRDGAARRATRAAEATPDAPAGRTGEGEEPQGKPSAGAGAGQLAHPAAAASPVPSVPPVSAASPVPAAAIVPYGARRTESPRAEGGFDFFGTQQGAPERPVPAIPSAHSVRVAAVQEEDLADVVGEEALAEQRTEEARAARDVIDLTAHDETEQLDLGALRNAAG
ncbi:hypothetical protein ACFVIM_01945 [Streptomyces sp. NPDC057638]|uniref:hypothetical protein n=1 Tax=Streptomyces sp. NPDC057638 TaxID=3346190 RepID=UPI00367F5195